MNYHRKSKPKQQTHIVHHQSEKLPSLELTKTYSDKAKQLNEKSLNIYYQNKQTCPLKDKRISSSNSKQVLIYNMTNLKHPKKQNITKQTLKICNKMKRISEFNPILASNKSYYISELINDWELHLLNKSNQQTTIFISHLMHGMFIFKKKKYQTPPVLPHLTLEKITRDKKKTIVFDLDQTLVHCINEEYSNSYPDQHRIFIQINANILTYSVNVRPHAIEVLGRLINHFNLILFTAGSQDYAQKVLEVIDPKRNIFKQRYYRQHCYLNYCGEKIKDLRMFKECLNNVVIVDNSHEAYSFQKNNGIPIIPFTDDSKDSQLLKLEQFLMKKILKCEDVSQVLANTFKFSEFNKYSTVKEIIQILHQPS